MQNDRVFMLACRAAFLEFVLFWLNYKTFGKSHRLLHAAWQKLQRRAGESVANQLREMVVDGDCLNTELRTQVGCGLFVQDM